MAALRFIGFTGEFPRLIPRLLPDMAAQQARDTRMIDGGLTPIRKSKVVNTFDPVPQAVSTIYYHNGSWLVWDGTVYAVEGPVADDRLYIMGDGAPKQLVSGTEYPLALPGPTTALTATESGTLDPDLSRNVLYSYTRVAVIDGVEEESEPAPLSNDVVVSSGMTVTLSGFVLAAAGRGVTLQRIYRTQRGSQGTQAYLVAERAESATDFVDDVDSPLLGILPSLDYNPPVDTLTGLTAMPNGMMAAFDGRTVYFAEPYRPHAWPEKYALQTNYDIVALGVFGFSLVVMTTGKPYVISGSAPDQMVMQELEVNLPCINARAVENLGYAVAYPSYDGLVVVSNGGARVVTEEVYYRDQWLRLNPFGWTSGQYDGRYFASYTYQDASGDTQEGTLIIDLTGQQPFILRTSVVTSTYYYDVERAALFYLDGAEVKEWDATSEVNAIQYWKSKQIVLQRPESFSAVLVEADDGLTEDEIAALEAEIAAVEAANTAIYSTGDLGGVLNANALNVQEVNGDDLQPVPSISRTLAMNIYADGELIHTINEYNTVKRIPTGFNSTKWEIEIFSDVPVSQINMASSVRELNRI